MLQHAPRHVQIAMWVVFCVLKPLMTPYRQEKLLKGRVHLRYDLRFGACIIMTTHFLVVVSRVRLFPDLCESESLRPS
jgi:hypothetical protein